MQSEARGWQSDECWLQFEVLEDAVEVIDDAGVVAVHVHLSATRRINDPQPPMSASHVPAVVCRRIPWSLARIIHQHV